MRGRLRINRAAVVLLGVILTFTVLPGVARGEGDEADRADVDAYRKPGTGVVRVAGEGRRVIAEFGARLDIGSIFQNLCQIGVRSVSRTIAASGETRLHLLDIRPDTAVEKVMERLRAIPGVVSVEMDRRYGIDETPDEPSFSSQWGLHNTGQTVNGVTGRPDADIDAPEAWDLERGNTYPAVVAVIDTGVDDGHPDLDRNVWRNQAESGVDGVDNDGNGYVDDVKGYNWVGISQPYCTDNPWYLGRNTGYRAFAQSLKGTGQYLTHVGIVLAASGSPQKNVIVSVRRDLSGPDLASMTIRPSEVTSYEDLHYKPLNTKVKLEDGVTYHLVVRTAQNDAENYYLLYDLWKNGDYYGGGCEWGFDGSSWVSYPDDDLCFVTNPNGMPRDDNGHGTHCAGIVAAEKDGQGVIGVSRGAKIMALKAGDCDGSFWTSDIISAVYYAADNGAKVISMSFGGRGYSTALANALAYARRKGAVLFAAAGNSGDSTVYYPAAFNGVVGVGATDSRDELASFSTRNQYVDLSAPGVRILSTLPRYRVAMNNLYGMPTGYAFCSGTSMATPMAAGVAALVLSRNPKYTPDQVEQAMKAGADDLGPAGWDQGFGHGRTNALRTLRNVPPVPYVKMASPPEDMVGSIITVIGKGFGERKGDSYVSFGGTVATRYYLWTDTRIQCKVPAGVSGVVELRVVTQVGVSNAIAFKVRPRITSVSPLSGSAGAEVTVRGTGFGDGRGTSGVFFGGIRATSYLMWSDTAIRCLVPSLPAGDVEVTVTTRGGTSNRVIFRVL